MDGNPIDEKRNSVRAPLRAEVEFSVLDVREYEKVKGQYGFRCRLGQAPGHPLTGSMDKKVELTEGAPVFDPGIVDFLIQMDEKINQILDLLQKHEKHDEIPVFCGEGLNISGSGMKILSEKNVAPGKVLDTRIRVSQYPGVLLQIFGEVVWVDSKDLDGTKQYEIALQFLDLDEDSKEWIISYVFQIQREAIRSDKTGGKG